MKSVFNLLPGFLGRHWLRIVIIGLALFVANRKQINFNVRLGEQAPLVAPRPSHHLGSLSTRVTPLAPPVESTPVETASEGLLSNLFGARETATPRNTGAPPVADKSSYFDGFSLFGSSASAAPAQPLLNALMNTDEATIRAFIDRFDHVAQVEQRKFGIPASITLASGLLHTQAGEHPSARRLNGYFNLPCGDDWAGDYQMVDGRCTRRYETAWLSIRDHSTYLTTGRFQPLTQFSATDYRKWAAGLEELRFNSASNLASQLIQTIERYQLHRFD